MWADRIFVMERKHALRLRAEHPKALQYKKPEILNIPDKYRFMAPELITILKKTIDLLLA